MKRYFDESSDLSIKTAGQLAAFYHHHLMNEVMPKWKSLSLDSIYGGYETNFDENWNIISSTKNIWAQARNLIMFTHIYEHVQQDDQWLSLIRSGHDFLVNYFYAGDGVWNYRVSDSGQQVLEGPVSLLGDMFALQALARYASLTGDFSDLPLIEATYQSVETHLKDPDYRNIMPHTWEPGLERHSHYMLMVNTLPAVQKILGRSRVNPLLTECIDKLLYFFAGTGRNSYLLEYRNTDGTMLDSDSGHLVNPGHIFESMWFCLKVCLEEHDTRRIHRILEIADHTFDMAVDREFGGLFHLLDCTGKTAYVRADVRNRQLNWNDKVDWVNCEALYLFALTAVATGKKSDFQRFVRHHNYCQKYFFDSSHGDWFATLSPDGNPIANLKGTKHRCAFHVPRALLDTYLVFQSYHSRKSED